jgi:hypothetical protein
MVGRPIAIYRRLSVSTIIEEEVMKALSALIVLGLFSFASLASAESNYAKDHPRVHEVNKRLKNQKNRVNQGEANGTLTQKQGNKIERQDGRINQEKKDMMANDGGHLTKADKRALNKQENRASNEISRDENKNEAAGAAPAAPAPGN